MGDLKSGWRRVKLGDVALNSTAATKDPVADGFDRYIIGKHILTDGPRVTTWNPVGDSEFGSRIRTIVRAGDIICTTRGPHLKVAVAEFDCLSAHTNFILRTRDPSLLLESVLEAVVRSDGFQDHLRKHFRGSTNLFVNWSDAAQYEFALPRIEEQHKIAIVCESASSLVRTLANGEEAATVQHAALAAHLMCSAPAAEVSDLLRISTRIGVGIASSAAHAYRESGVAMIRNTDIHPGRINTAELLFLDPAFDEDNASKRVAAGDIVVARTGVPGTAAVVPAELDGAQTFTTLIVSPRRDVIDPAFLAVWINGPVSQSFIRSRKGGGVQQNMNAGLLELLPTWCPSLSRQREVVDLLGGAMMCIQTVQHRRQLAAKLHRDFLRTVLSAEGLAT